MLCLNGSEEAEREFKSQRAWSSFRRLKRILTHRGAPALQKLRLLDRAVSGVLLWAREVRQPTVD
eukprot:8370605-Alexandrium_andersonii.AAC.1